MVNDFINDFIKHLMISISNDYIGFEKLRYKRVIIICLQTCRTGNDWRTCDTGSKEYDDEVKKKYMKF